MTILRNPEQRLSPKEAAAEIFAAATSSLCQELKQELTVVHQELLALRKEYKVVIKEKVYELVEAAVSKEIGYLRQTIEEALPQDVYTEAPQSLEEHDRILDGLRDSILKQSGEIAEMHQNLALDSLKYR